MGLLERYLMKTLLFFIVAASLLVLSVDALFALVREMKVVGQADYTSWVALQHVALTLPRRLYNLFPMASLLGAIMGLGALAANSELIAMRAGGLSLAKVVRTVLLLACVLAMLVAVMGNFLATYAEQVANIVKAEARGRGQALYTNEGVWLRDGQSFLYISQVSPEGELLGITRFQFNRNGELIKSTYAETGKFLAGNRLLVQKLRSSEFSAAAVTAVQAVSEEWNSDVDRSLLDVLVQDPEEMSIAELKQYIAYLKSNGLEYEQYDLAFWQKWLQPLSTVVMIFLAVPIIFGPLRQAVMGLRLLAAVLLGFSFYVLNQLFGPLALVFDTPVVVAVLAPAVVFAALALLLMQKVR